MTVNRRTVIKSVGASGTIVALAGCINVSENTETPDESGGNGNGSDGNGSDDDQTDEDTPTPEPGVATFWHARSGEDKSYLESDLETFNDESHHSVKIAKISDLEAKTTSAIPAGDGPHLFEWAHDWVGDYLERGFLADQSGELDVDLESTYTGAGVDAITFDGGVYGLPYAAETVGLVYNKDMVDQPPETFEEMQGIMEDHHDPASNQYGLSYPIDAYFISAWAHAFGGYYYDAEKDELGLTKEETKRGLQLVIDELFPYSPDDHGYDAQAAVFVDGNAPLAINGPWYIGSAADQGIDVGVAKLPTVEGSQPSPYTGVQMFYFAKKMADGSAADADAARRFAEWYTTSEDVLLNNAQKSGFIPVHQEVAASDELGANTQGFAASIDTGRPMPAHPHMNQVWVPFQDGFIRALNGDQSLDDAMEQAASEIRSEWES